MSATKYYHAENAGRDIAGVRFDVYSISSGIAFGIYQTDDAILQSKLDELVKNPRSAVTAITDAEYATCDKKKPTSLSSFHQSQQTSVKVEQHLQHQATALKGAGAVVTNEPVVATPEAETVVVDGQVATTEDALKVTTLAVPTDGKQESDVPTVAKAEQPETETPKFGRRK